LCKIRSPAKPTDEIKVSKYWPQYYYSISMPSAIP